MPQIDLSAEQKAELFKLNRKQDAAFIAVIKALERAAKAKLKLYFLDGVKICAIDARKIKKLANQSERIDTYTEFQVDEIPYTLWAGGALYLLDSEDVRIIHKTDKEND